MPNAFCLVTLLTGLENPDYCTVFFAAVSQRAGREWSDNIRIRISYGGKYKRR